MTQCIVADFGSSYTKIGSNNDDEPSTVFPSIIGRPRRRYVSQYPEEVVFAGLDAVENRSQLTLVNPIDHGYVEDWDDLEELYSYAVLCHQETLMPKNALSDEVDLFDNASLLLTTPPRVPTKHLEAMAEITFEAFGFAELCLATGGTLSLLGQGRHTGIAVELGDGVTQIVPIIEGFNDRMAIKRTDIGGSEVTQYLHKLLCDRGFNFVKRDEVELLRRIKESNCYFSKNLAKEADKKVNVKYTLPDGLKLSCGKTLNLSNELFYAPEVMFDPSLMLRDEPGLTDIIWQCLREVSVEVRRPLLRNVSLSGGGSLVNGLPERLQFEMESTCPPTALNDVHVHADKDRLFAAWRGGQILCSEGFKGCSKDKLWVDRSEWLDQGSRVLNEKCM